MLQLKKFIIQNTPPPVCSLIVQSWYTPLLGGYGEELADFQSSVVTIGFTNTQARPARGEPAPKIEMFILNAIQYSIDDIVTLRSHISNSRDDYMRLLVEGTKTTRNPTKILLCHKGHVHRPPLLEFNNLEYVNIEMYRLETLSQLLMATLHHIYKIRFYRPSTGKLKSGDALLLTLLNAYPSGEAYSMVAALSTLLYWVEMNGYLNREADNPTKLSRVQEVY